jgi:magnesium-transporting ATPase (P-type)
MAPNAAAAKATPKDWHLPSAGEVLQQLDAQPQGLQTEQARQRLAQYGPNSLPQQPPATVLEILLRQFQSPLIYVLLAAAAVAIFVGDYKDAGFIGVVLLLNAAIGGYQEWRAEKNSRALQQLLHIRAKVRRDGELTELDAEELVPGDVVELESGNRVPADLRLLQTQGAEIDESLLTGESLAVLKDAQWQGTAQTPPADRLNLAYAASTVIRGRALGVVVETGRRTMVGQLAVDVQSSAGGKPPLVERMEKFAHTIAWLVLVVVSAISVLGVVLHGETWQSMFMFGVALAVSAIPEGLPAALTVALSVATSRMAARKVIVRRLAAVEGLGSCTLIASDKTGTLTCNELTVRDIRLPDGSQLLVEGQGFAPIGAVQRQGTVLRAADHAPLEELLRVAVLCNEGDLHQRNGEWIWHGDPTDIALLSLGEKAGLRRAGLLQAHPQVHAIPFEPELQYAATFHKWHHGHIRVFVKGGPERVLAMCEGSISAEERARLEQLAREMAAEGYRVLALADGDVQGPLDPAAPAPPPGQLRFRGFVGMIDPLRPGVREAIKSCHQAGITVCMVTGDHPVTALAISRDLGLAQEMSQVISGTELAQLSPEEKQAAIRRARVFARVTPRQKLELVEAARAEGHYVAVTGDGVNDAPALRAANIGVAMGKGGTDVARDAAELVISDDNFASIVAGVEEGRVAYDNVRKVIYLLISTGAAEVLMVTTAFLVGEWLPLPLIAVQLLWLNLVTNGIQDIALAFEPGEHGILKRKPRKPSESIFDKLMIERTVVAACYMGLVGISAFCWMIQSGWEENSARNGLLLLMVLFENFHIGNCRSETRSALCLSPFRSPILLGGAALAFLIHVAAMHVPFFQSLLRTEPVSWQVWAALLPLAATIVVVMEIHKWTWKLRHPEVTWFRDHD